MRTNIFTNRDKYDFTNRDKYYLGYSCVLTFETSRSGFVLN